jgi:hypothetical protein
MIKRTYQWYRIVSTTPTADTIKARKLAVQSLVEKIDESGDYDLLAACVVGAIRGFDTGFSPANVIEAILRPSKETRPFLYVFFVASRGSRARDQGQGHSTEDT